MKKCGICGEVVTDNTKYCPKCGAEIEGYSEPVEAQVVESTNDNDDKLARELDTLRGEFSKKAKNNLIWSIVSVALCCCTITAIVSLVLSITLMFDLNKLSNDAKATEDYRKIRNKNIVALVIGSIIIVMGIFNTIDSIVNYDENQQMISSMLNEIYNQ